MKGLLKTKSPITQLLIFIGITLVSFSILGLIGEGILVFSFKLSLNDLKDPSNWDMTNPKMISYLRGSQMVQFISLFLLPVMICGWLFSDNTKQYLGLKKPSSALYFGAGILLLIVALPFAGGLGVINKNIQLPTNVEDWMRSKEELASKIQNGLLARHTIKDLVLNIVFVAALAGIGEELLCRGMLQRLLIRIFKNQWIGIVVAAAIFSAIHMQFYGFLPRLALGVLLGLIYWYSGSLWVAIVSHFIYDTLAIVAEYVKPGTVNSNDASGSSSTILLMATISFLLVSLIVAWMIKRSNTRYEEVYANDHIPVKDHPFDF